MRRTRTTQFVGLVLLALMVSAWSGCSTVQGWLGHKSVGQTLIVSGESLDFTSHQFENAGKEFTARCNAQPPTLGAKTCNDFRAFGIKFKEVWPHVTATWRAAVRSRDAAMQTDTEKIANGLYAELFAFLGQLVAGGK